MQSAEGSNILWRNMFGGIVLITKHYCSFIFVMFQAECMSQFVQNQGNKNPSNGNSAGEQADSWNNSFIIEKAVSMHPGAFCNSNSPI